MPQLLASLCLAALPALAAPAPRNHPPSPLRGQAVVFAHRGASALRPEHTLGGYQLAMELGADYVEPDLRMTKDGVFIALHDNSLNRTTDVAIKPEFVAKARHDDKGKPYWVPEDFTLAELKTLRTRQATAKRPAEFDGLETIPTLEEIVALVRAYTAKTGRKVGLVPELRGHADAFVKFVRDQRLEDPDQGVPLYLQSFSLGDLKRALPQLKSPGALLLSEWPNPKQLETLKQEVDAVAVIRNLVLAEDAKERIAEMHAAGFDVIAWTFADDAFGKRFKNSREELELALANGTDAFFTDSTATGAEVRGQFRTVRKNAASTLKPATGASIL